MNGYSGNDTIGKVLEILRKEIDQTLSLIKLPDIATTDNSGLMSPDMVIKLAGIDTSANNYVHPTSAGNKHIPAGGQSGQILRWSADGTAIWDDDKDTTYPMYQKSIAENFATNFRTQTKGDTESGHYISTVRCELADVPNAPRYGTGLAWGKGDTHGYLGTNYSTAEAYLGAGSNNKLNWVKKLVFADGTGASGTWGISISGNAANVSGIVAIVNGGTGATTAAGALDALLAGIATKGFTTSKATNTYLAGNQGNAIINSSAAAGSYTMLAKMNSTNGYFTHGTYGNKYLLQYTAKTTVDAGTNSVTKSVTLLGEDGNTSFPGTVSAAAFNGNAATATKLATARKIGSASFDGSADITLASIGAAAVSHTHDLKFTNRKLYSGNITGVTTINCDVAGSVFAYITVIFGTTVTTGLASPSDGDTVMIPLFNLTDFDANATNLIATINYEIYGKVKVNIRKVNNTTATFRIDVVPYFLSGVTAGGLYIVLSTFTAT